MRVLPRRKMRGDGTAIEIVRMLVLIQGSIAVLSTLEALVMSAAFGFVTAPLVLVNLAAAALALWLAAGLARHSGVARRLTIAAEVMILLIACIDLLLALVLTREPLELVPTLVRFVLPITVIRMLRGPVVRAYFAKQLPPPPIPVGSPP